MAEVAEPVANKKARIVGRHYFKPGESGNPNGRPKAIFKFSEYLRTFLKSPHPQAAEINVKLGYNAVKTQLDVIVQRLAKDDPKILLQYGFGKPIETLEVSGVTMQQVIVLKHSHELAGKPVDRLDSDNQSDALLSDIQEHQALMLDK